MCQVASVLSDSLQPHGLSLTRLSVVFSRQEYWSGCHVLFQGIFPTQGLNLCLFRILQWQVGSLSLVPPGKHKASKAGINHDNWFICYIEYIEFQNIALIWCPSGFSISLTPVQTHHLLSWFLHSPPSGLISVFTCISCWCHYNVLLCEGRVLVYV